MNRQRPMATMLALLALLLGPLPGAGLAQEAAGQGQQAPQFFLPKAKKLKAQRFVVPAASSDCAAACPDKEQLRLAAWVGQRKFAAEAPGLASPGQDKPKEPRASKATQDSARKALAQWRTQRRALTRELAQPFAELLRAGALPEFALDQWKSWRLSTQPSGAGPVWNQQDLGPGPVDGVWSSLLDLKKGEVLELQVKEARPANGSALADPLALLFELKAEGEPERLVLLARADDQGDDPLPRLRYQAPRAMRVRVVVAAQRPGASGRGTVVLLLGGRKVVEAGDAVFGGVRLADLQVGAGDRFLANAGSPGGGPGAADPVLLLLADEALAGSPALLSNNATALAPELLVPEDFVQGPAARGLGDRVRCLGEQLAAGPAWQEACLVRPLGCFSCFPGEGRATLLLASFGASPLDAPLLVHSRAQVPDEDHDGLDRRTEKILGTCDAADCMPKGLPRKEWKAQDSDLDGISDTDELFGVRRCFPRRPLAPDFDPGPCLDRDADGYCDRDCAKGDFQVQQPLGRLLEADPLAFDLFIENDSWQLQDQDQPKALFPAQRRVEEMGLLFSSLKGPLPVRLHWFNDGVLPLGSVEALPHLPSAAHRHAWFNLQFSPERRQSGVFRYVLGVKGSGAQSDVAGRAAIIGMEGGDSLVFRVVHELGHMLGLSHNHDRKAPDRNPFYTSIMNYGFVYSLPPAAPLEPRPQPCQSSGDGVCPQGLRCLPVEGQRYCLPPCGDLKAVLESGRQVFSDGGTLVARLGDEVEGLEEQGWSKDYLPWLFCFIDETKAKGPAVGLRRLQHEDCRGGNCVTCSRKGGCSVDWNRDGRLEPTGPLDLDGDGKASAGRLKNGNDLARIFLTGARGLLVSGYQKVVLFYSGFEDGPFGPLSWAPTVTDGSAGTWEDPTNGCDEKGRWAHCKKRRGQHAALFRGPASGDGPIVYDFCAQDPGNCREGYLAPEGFALSLRVKVLSPSWGGEGASIITVGGYIVRVEVDESGDGLIWTVKDPKGRKKTLKQPAGFGLWQRVTLQVDQPNRRWSLGIVHRDRMHSLEGRTPKAASELSRFSVGGEPGSTSKLTGLLDDLILVRGTVKNF